MNSIKFKSVKSKKKKAVKITHKELPISNLASPIDKLQGRQEERGGREGQVKRLKTRQPTEAGRVSHACRPSTGGMEVGKSRVHS